MDITFTKEQLQIAKTARNLLEKRSSMTEVRRVGDGGGHDPDLWATFCELGWPGIAISEEFGGLGFGLVELTILVEQLGYAATPSRFLSNAMAGVLLSVAGDSDQQDRWLAGIADGSATGTVAAASEGTGWLVPDGGTAAVAFLVWENAAVQVVDTSTADMAERLTIDPTSKFSTLVPSEDAPRLTAPADGIARAEVALAAAMLGVSQRALDITVAYVKERRQFDLPVGAFQAVSHRCTDLLLEIERARSLVYYAAWAADHEADALPRAAAMAKAASVEAALHSTGAAIQLHGGIGFTWAADLHWLYKRAHVLASQLGSARLYRHAAGLPVPAGAIVE